MRGFASDFAIEISPVDAAVAERAARIRGRLAERAAGGRRRSSVAPRDALILATADGHAQVDRVMGGDARWTAICRSLTVSLVRLRA